MEEETRRGAFMEREWPYCDYCGAVWTKLTGLGPLNIVEKKVPT